MKERCGTCRFGQSQRKTDKLKCRRWPPREEAISPQPGIEPIWRLVWPMMASNDWCGEWQKKTRTE